MALAPAPSSPFPSPVLGKSRLSSCHSRPGSGTSDEQRPFPSCLLYLWPERVAAARLGQPGATSPLLNLFLDLFLFRRRNGLALYKFNPIEVYFKIHKYGAKLI